MESGADKYRPKSSNRSRRGAVSVDGTSSLNHHDSEVVQDTSPYHLKAMELMSLAKLLDCKMETMPSLFGHPADSRVESEGHDLKGRPSLRVGSESSGLCGGSMSHFSVVKSVLSGKKVNHEKEEKKRL